MTTKGLPLPAPSTRRVAAAMLMSLALALLSACSEPKEFDGFQLFFKKADANPSIWSAFPKATYPTLGPMSSRGGADVMADPGERCELGCLVTGFAPRKCLLYGGQSSTHVFLVYHEGTIMLHTMLVVFELNGDEATIVWGGDVSSFMSEDVPGLRKAIAAGASLHRQQLAKSGGRS